MNSTSRKLRKLRRDPVRFFRDSWWFRRLIPNARHETITSVLTTPSDTLVTTAASSSSTSASPLTVIGVAGKIDFSPSCKGAPGVRTGLLLPTDQQDFFGKYLAHHADFSPLQLPSLSIGFFDVQLELACTELDLINRIPQNSKKKLDELDTIFLVDAPAALVNVIGACATHLRVFSVVSDELLIDGIDTRLVAGVVYVGRPGPAINLRTLHCSSFESVYPQLRRLVSENARKAPNMLLAIRGGENGFAGIADFDTAKFGGVVFCDPVTPIPGRRFIEYLEAFDSGIRDLYLSESIYLRYKTLCELVEAGGATTSFFAKALADGVTFDVRLLPTKS